MLSGKGNYYSVFLPPSPFLASFLFFHFFALCFFFPDFFLLSVIPISSNCLRFSLFCLIYSCLSFFLFFFRFSHFFDFPLSFIAACFLLFSFFHLVHHFFPSSSSSFPLLFLSFSSSSSSVTASPGAPNVPNPDSNPDTRYVFRNAGTDTLINKR